MYRVAVLMSTYNGEKYLNEQIDSILSQVDVNLDLYIRDDGSTDNTISIIESYCMKYTNIKLYRETNIGVGNSFMELLYKVPNDYDYYCFSDQDDVWMKNKIISAINCINENNKNLYASNQTNIDKFGNIIGNRYNNNSKLHFEPIEILFSNDLPGCTMVFTKSFYNILTEYSNRPSQELLKIRIHDTWLAVVSSLYNDIIYDKNSYIYYRQHEKNVVGAYQLNLIGKLVVRIKKILNRDKRNGRSKLAKELYKLFQNKINNIPLIYASAFPNKLESKLYLIKHIDYLSKINNETKIGLFLKILFNIY